MAGGNEAVPAVIAGPAKHCDRACVGEKGGDLIGHGAAGIFHELKARHPAFHGKAVGLTHLRRRQQLEHRWHDKAKPQRKRKGACLGQIAEILCILLKS
jgi:hypothetical protein